MKVLGLEYKKNYFLREICHGLVPLREEVINLFSEITASLTSLTTDLILIKKRKR